MDLHSQEAAQSAREQAAETRVTHLCRNCGASLEPADVFCPECAECVRGQNCGNCGESFRGSFCPACGWASDSLCATCGAEVVGTFCGECGESIAIEEMEIADGPSLVLSTGEAQQLLKDLRQSMGPELAAEEEKARQRVILLRERNYFQEREERVAAASRSASAKKRYLPSREEVAWNKKMAESITSFVKAEVDRLRAERDRAAKAEAQRLRDLLNGTWMMRASWGYCLLKTIVEGEQLTGSMFLNCPLGDNVNRIGGQVHGNSVLFSVTARSGGECSNHGIRRFRGTVAPNGTAMRGEIEFPGEIETGVFVRGS